MFREHTLHPATHRRFLRLSLNGHGGFRRHDDNRMLIAARRFHHVHVALRRWFEIFLHDTGYKVPVVRYVWERVGYGELHRIGEAKRDRAATVVSQCSDMTRECSPSRSVVLKVEPLLVFNIQCFVRLSTNSCSSSVSTKLSLRCLPIRRSARRDRGDQNFRAIGWRSSYSTFPFRTILLSSSRS